jgi:Holliday junction resolvase RusA-like endonuclease
MAAIRESVTFTVIGPPRPKERPRVTSRGTFTPARTLQYERAVAAVGSLHCGPGWDRDGMYYVRFVFVFASRRRRDVDNCLKAALDGLNGVAWRDDEQVETATCTKRYELGGVERTEVHIARTGNYTRVGRAKVLAGKLLAAVRGRP